MRACLCVWILRLPPDVWRLLILLHHGHILTLMGDAGTKPDGDTPPKQRMLSWRGDLQTAVSGPPANDWAGLSQEQDALLGALQVRLTVLKAVWQSGSRQTLRQ